MQPQLVGDYNGDDSVDAADYTVWRDKLGTAVLTNEDPGASPGTVDQVDLAAWKNHFGLSTAGSGASATQVEADALDAANAVVPETQLEAGARAAASDGAYRLPLVQSPAPGPSPTKLRGAAAQTRASTGNQEWARALLLAVPRLDDRSVAKGKAATSGPASETNRAADLDEVFAMLGANGAMLRKQRIVGL